MSVAIRPGTTFTFEQPKPLFSTANYVHRSGTVVRREPGRQAVSHSSGDGAERAERADRGAELDRRNEGAGAEVTSRVSSLAMSDASPPEEGQGSPATSSTTPPRTPGRLPSNPCPCGSLSARVCLRRHALAGSEADLREGSGIPGGARQAGDRVPTSSPGRSRRRRDEGNAVSFATNAASVATRVSYRAFAQTVPRLPPLRQIHHVAARVSPKHLPISRAPGHEQHVGRFDSERVGLAAGFLTQQHVAIASNLVGHLRAASVYVPTYSSSAAGASEIAGGSVRSARTCDPISRHPPVSRSKCIELPVVGRHQQRAVVVLPRNLRAGIDSRSRWFDGSSSSIASGAHQQNASERDAHLPAARERADVAVASSLRETQPREDFARFALERVAAQLVVAGLNVAEALDQLSISSASPGRPGRARVA